MPGLPDVDTLTDYGGAFADAEPVVTATTDESAASRNLYAMSVAGMTNTAIRAWCSYTTVDDSNPSDPATNVHGAVWGSTTAVKPIVTWVSEGITTITWPVTVVDALGVTHAVKLRRGWGAWQGLIVSGPLLVTVTANNVATVVQGGDNPTYTLTVWVI